MENFFTKESADSIYKEIQSELKFIPRGQLKFSMMGQNIDIPRIKALQGTLLKNGDYPVYRYGVKFFPDDPEDKRDYPDTQMWTKTTRKLRDLLGKRYGEICTHLVANKYENEKDHIGYHHDKTTDMTSDGNVYIFSFGETRILEFAKVGKGGKGSKSSLKLTYSIPIKHGSLYILTPETNKMYKHKIYKDRVSKNMRISLTFRKIINYYSVSKKIFYRTSDKYIEREERKNMEEKERNLIKK